MRNRSTVFCVFTQYPFLSKIITENAIKPYKNFKNKTKLLIDKKFHLLRLTMK